MNYDRDDARGSRGAWLRSLRRCTAVALSGCVAAAALHAQQSATPSSLVFDGVTVVDVVQGTLVPDQRVVIGGNRIQAVGPRGSVSVPKNARVVAARGKYLIPGLWDMHTHSHRSIGIFYPLFLANGVTGIRDASSKVPLDTIRHWWGEILAGTRLGARSHGAALHRLLGPSSDLAQATSAKRDGTQEPYAVMDNG